MKHLPSALRHCRSTSASLVPSPLRQAGSAELRGRYIDFPINVPSICTDGTFTANVPGFNPMCRAFGAMYRAWNVPAVRVLLIPSPTPASDNPFPSATTSTAHSSTPFSARGRPVNLRQQSQTRTLVLRAQKLCNWELYHPLRTAHRPSLLRREGCPTTSSSHLPTPTTLVL
ncbi:hypothetical protein B0H10DRAFT_1955949 [Mycena sp. CBHHK59/15]|nr:hypothetical protein B0H10DRAFT_1955949 [Mycena sp. CBHHK59/15]